MLNAVRRGIPVGCFVRHWRTSPLRCYSVQRRVLGDFCELLLAELGV